MFRDLILVKNSLDNSITGFVVGLTILFASLSGILIAGMDAIALVIGIFLCLMFPYVLIWKENAGIEEVIFLLKGFIAFGVMHLIIANNYLSFLVVINRSIIFMPYYEFQFIGALSLFVAGGIGILITVIGLKEMLTYRQL
jgi:hypothetical protein